LDHSTARHIISYRPAPPGRWEVAVLGSTRCPRCAKHLPADSAFCRRCGRDLRAPHGAAGAAAPTASLPRRAVPPPPVPALQRGNGRLATLAFALFALLFIAGLLFSTRSSMRARSRPAATPAETQVEGQGEWGGDHGESGGAAPQRQESGKRRW
jgi:hypothetical protein